MAPMTTKQLLAKLYKKYRPPSYAFLTQVRNATGYPDTIRTADAMAMGLWASRGIHLTGFELKVSRSDWLTELKKPDKAEEIAKYCHFWYIVVPDPAIVNLDELPHNWGLMAASGPQRSIKIIKEAPKLDTSPISYEFLASVFRNCTKGLIPEETIADKIQTAWQQGKDQANNQHKYQMDDHAKLVEQIEKFEDASGIRIDRYSNMESIGAAVKAVLTGADKDIENRLRQLSNSATYIATTIQQELKKAGVSDP
jgi:hypothetical protein